MAEYITVPNAGDDTDVVWAQAAANRLNRIIPLHATPASTTSSTSWSDVPGLTFPVIAGKSYHIRVQGLFNTTAVGNGFVIGYKRPAGSAGLVSSYATMYGNGGSVTPLVERVSATDDGGTGIATMDSTASRQFWIEVEFTADISGTFALRWRRPGATNSNVTMLLAGGMAVSS